MNIDTLFKSVVPLSKGRHQDTYFETGQGYDFARSLHCVPALFSEFPNLVREYPIVFWENEEDVGVVALLALREDENLFVSADGSWSADYMPAILRQYPFTAMLRPSDDQKSGVLCIAEDHPGFNKAEKGYALYDSEGELSEFTTRAQSMVSQATSDGLHSEEICKRLKELDVLSPLQAMIETEIGEKFKLAGVQAVNRNKLNDLPAKTLKDLQKNGTLEMLHLHQLSLGNLRSLATRAAGHTKPQSH
ncbi:SapC family protein [Aliiroseovarius sp. PrR006]|uniref:SapC family protein n=1 Tax=Aliiroseovarius sp. PrR006 TaxID=2706883 RepID=UPI0013D61EC7|nr:SapC family protein [Aliiroseovarius sp. PrR006]NDW53449.1 SapC family protein [Aliiroseovarius sp. PrR006]